MKFGILSTASIAGKVIAGIHKSGSAEVYAVASRDLQKAKDFANKFNVPVAYGSYAELLQDSQVEVVYIPLPTNIRLEWVLKAAEAKKHVLCEKPFLSADEVRQMREACSKNGVHFQDNTMMVHHPRFEQIKTKEKMFQRDSKGLNALQRMHTDFSFYNALNSADIRFNPSLERDGCLGDMGWYNIRASLVFFDYELPSRVVCFAKFKDQTEWSDQIDTSKQAIISATGTLFFSRGRVATFSCSFEELSRQTLVLTSPEEAVTIDDFVLPRRNDPFVFPREVYDDHAEYFVSNQSTDSAVSHTVEPCVQHARVIQNFVAATKAPSDDKHTKYGQETWKTTKVLEAAVSSARANGKVIYLEEVRK